MAFKNKTLLVLMVIFTILNLCDVVTTIFIKDGESNPIFNLVGSLWVMILLKILIVGFIWIYALRNLFPSTMSYYILIAIIVYGSLALALAQVANIYGIIHPTVIQQAAATPIPQRTNSYFSFIFVVYIIPILLSILNFWIYDRSYKSAIINKEIAKKNSNNIWRIQQ